MDVLPLPPSPRLDQYRKRAKDLVRAAKSPDGGAIRDWATEWLATLARLRNIAITPFVQGSFDRAIAAIEERIHERVARSGADGTSLALADAQFLLARAHGYESWPDFASDLERMSGNTVGGRDFEAAVDAVVAGDIATLDSLLHESPALIAARSTRAHRATLLHYVAANGVEDFRQQTPPNAVAVARLLLDAGAAVDALANTYGGGSDQTTMNLLVSSVHPAHAGVQAALVETLLDFGAAVDGLAHDESPLMTALAFGYLAAADALARRGARVDTVLAAAALGRSALIARFVVNARTLAPDVSLIGPRWFGLPNDASAHIALAFVWACRFGRTQVVELMLKKGVNPVSADGDRQTGLHWAAAHGHMEIIDLLLAHGAPLEAVNTYGGTVLGQTRWFARNDPADGVDYAAVIRKLIGAGANVVALALLVRPALS